MTRTFQAHYDGKVIIPDEPVDLPVGVPLLFRVVSVSGEMLPEWGDATTAPSIEGRREGVAAASHDLLLPETALERETEEMP